MPGARGKPACIGNSQDCTDTDTEHYFTCWASQEGIRGRQPMLGTISALLTHALLQQDAGAADAGAGLCRARSSCAWQDYLRVPADSSFLSCLPLFRRKTATMVSLSPSATWHSCKCWRVSQCAALAVGYRSGSRWAQQEGAPHRPQERQCVPEAAREGKDAINCSRLLPR